MKKRIAIEQEIMVGHGGLLARRAQAAMSFFYVSKSVAARLVVEGLL